MKDAQKVERLAQIYRALRGRAGCCELQDLMASVLETVDPALAKAVWEKDAEISWSEYLTGMRVAIQQGTDNERI